MVAFSSVTFSQSIIINEVSQGVDGSKEYIEFLVVDSTANYVCSSSTPPTIDIRQWIIDDNSGYHGSNGVAPGAIRFSNDPIWSAVPLGTLILIYNGDDFNPEINDGEVDLTDGICQIVAPISDPQYFESNVTTPGDVACDYPLVGWTPGADWTNISMRNGGDCARIVNTAGCEVFSVCYGDVDDNTQIYFAGSGSNRVFSFMGGDPEDQANWVSGCADVPDCGTQDQTPGAANSAENLAYIAQFNNNCNPITPLDASAIVDPSSNCADVVTITGSGSGSIPGYTYEWFDNTYSTLIDSIATTDSVAIGTYHVIVTSSIGCVDTASVEVFASSNSATVTFVGDQSICEGSELNITASTNLSGGTFDWNNNGPSPDSVFTITPTSNTTYPLQFVLGDCVTDTFVNITLIDAPNVTAGPDLSICIGASILLEASGAVSYVWSDGSPNGSNANPANGSSFYSVIGTGANGCEGYDTIFVQTNTVPIVDANASVISGNAVLFVDFDNLSNASTYEWNYGNSSSVETTFDGSTSYSSPGTYTVTLTGFNGNCFDTWMQEIVVFAADPLVYEIPNVFTPNGDLVNDLYEVSLTNAKSFEASIVNRWGNTVYEMTGLEDAWDGTVNGNSASEGTYFIRYTIEGLDESIVDGQSIIHLKR